MTAKIGWDQLLKIRSNVFVMEEEYRSEKQPVTSDAAGVKRNASTDALRGSPVHAPVNGDDHTDDGKSADGESTAPTLVAENGVTGSTVDDSIEKPPHTITPQEVKSGNEDVRFKHLSNPQ